ncbi:unnamed protein product [Diabrotica balteata]|uniref:THAP-type domain-containing protein n=1 Tax=Diabrotica balteata TaxID=107213 RepID=A0A9N9XBW4_DIABA|nr:unnamed protein product [Diabrotica balteata]
MRCAVFGCSSDNQSKRNPCPNTRFFRFPKEENLIKQWVHATGRKDKFNSKTASICSKHFAETDFYTNLKHQLLNYRPKNYRGLKKDVVPNKNLPTMKPEVSRIGHGSALKKSQRKQVIDELLSSECEDSGGNVKQEGIEDNSQNFTQGNGFSNNAAEKSTQNVSNKNLPMVKLEVFDELLSSECEGFLANIKQEVLEDNSQSFIRGNGFSNNAAEKSTQTVPLMNQNQELINEILLLKQQLNAVTAKVSTLENIISAWKKN